MSVPDERRRLRLVDRVTLLQGPLPFASVAERLVTPETKLLVLDLDRTTHLGRNMGELLGWEIGAFTSYGRDELVRMEEERKTGRLIFDPRHPVQSLRYLVNGARTWAGPGLFYLFFGKIPDRSRRLRRLAYRWFGPDPVRAVQRVPQTVLLQLLTTVPDKTLRYLAERVWDRHAPDQVIEREDLERLRARAPGLRVVISSASPRVVVEVARERLGADLADGSELGRINSGPAKIARLAERFSELTDPEVETVGVTDTGYGEDHCWVDHLTRVADVNSAHPFPPIVASSSPLAELCSAQIMTRSERRRLEEGEADWVDSRRPNPPREHTRVFEREDLERRLSDLLERAEALAAAPERNAYELAELMREARRRLEAEAEPAPERASSSKVAPA
jgi:hypothetical protein